MPAKRGRKKAVKGKCQTGAKSVPPPSPEEEAIPPPSPNQPRDESPQSQHSRGSTPSDSRSQSPTQQQKKLKTMTDLTVAQEEDMASWLEENELLYNKKLNAYKDYRKKDSLWESKAVSIGKDVLILKTWYRSIRSRFTRLNKKKSGDGTSELTERDHWILTNFAWLNEHVVEVKKKTTVSMKEKIAAAASIDDGKDDPSTDSIDIETVATNPHRLEPLPRSSSKSSSKKAIQEEEERLLSNIAAREEQSVTFQTKVLEMLAPSKATERTRYADWAKEVMVSLHPSLWLKFQRECTNLLYTYQEKSEELLNPVTQQQHNSSQQPHYTTPQQQQQQPQQPQQQYPVYPRAASGTSSSSAMWQPPPQQWPSTVQPNMSVWGSQNSSWVQQQLTELQPMTTAARGPSTAAISTGPTSSATTTAGPLSLSSIIRETIGIPNTSLESEVTTQNE